MRRVILFLSVVALMLMMLAPAALADHRAGPCNDSGEPGNSDYAAHFVAFEAKAGLLGAGAHIPGAHKGFSACNPSGM
ncbi:MAG: hypothetical protein O6705_07105 [Actinobacteria bacterium]|nr:hypothetical protein [Actinomycetota bacterium]